MTYDPERHHRRSIRLKKYDYAQGGAYFVTICAHGRECVFGEMVVGELRPNVYGSIVEQCWEELPQHYLTVELDAFVVMPNHIHGIIFLIEPKARINTTAAETPARPPLSEVVRAFKTFSARRVNAMRETPGTSIWQRGYYEHIIRSTRSLDRLRSYIGDNPARWDADQLHPNTSNPW